MSPGVWDAAADAWRCLSFERSRARSPAQALRAWLRGQRERFRRVQRIGLGAFIALLRTEAACALAGIAYPAEDAGQCAPWHLPERFGNLRANDLPPHAVIAPDQLASWAAETGMPMGSAAVLRRLALEAPVAAFWQDIPWHGNAPPLEPPARVAVCLHLFYPELWPLLRAQLALIPEPWDLYVSVPAFAATAAWRSIVHDQPRVRFLPSSNRGRDVAPFLAWLQSGVLDRHELVLKLHGKRSPHTSGGDAWRDAMVQSLIGDSTNVSLILGRFRADPHLAMVGPASARRTFGQDSAWAKNEAHIRALARALGLGAVDKCEMFFAGTMFWFRPSAFTCLRNAPMQTADFPLEMAQTEGTLAHALERLLAVVVARTGARVLAWEGETSARELVSAP